MHIVLFTGGGAPSPADVSDVISWAGRPDFTVAADSGLDTLDLYNGHFGGNVFDPDYIIGDMDSLRDRKLLEKYRSAQIQECPVDKDYTDTELGLEICVDLKRSADDIITMIGGSGGRADHFLGIYETFGTGRHCDIWVCGEQRIIFLADGSSLALGNLCPGDPVSIARTVPFYTEGSIDTCGLEWGTDVMRRRGMPSISNRISMEYFQEGRPVTFYARKADFLVFAPAGCRITYYGK